MDNQIFDLHLVESFNLARSLIIKNEQTAVAINNDLLLKNSNYIISEDDKKTWKYYLNLIGEYHEKDISTLRDYNYKNGIKVNKFVKVRVTGTDVALQEIVVPDFIYDEGIQIFDRVTDTFIDPSEYVVKSRDPKTNTSVIAFPNGYLTSALIPLISDPEKEKLLFTYTTNNGKIVIKSLDTLEYIEYTKESFLAEFSSDIRLLHKATKKAYDPGSNFYNEVVRNYPDFELLIKCTINPVGYRKLQQAIQEDPYLTSISFSEQTERRNDYLITYATEARENLILQYNQELVEEGEEYLIIELQKTLDNLKFRWTVPGYFLLDELYSMAQDAIIYIHLTSIIEGIRLTKCKTFEAHSFHIKQYLASHNGLDVYFDKLTKKQVLFLYRNIRYIQRYAGKEDTFDKLVENMMRQRGIPLKEWNMKHDTTDIETKLLPDTLMNGKDIVITGNSFGGLEDSIENVMIRQNPKAMHNEEVFDESLQKVTFLNDTGQDSFLKTKVLESAMIDYEDTQPFKLTEILYNHWIFLSAKLDEFGRPLYQSSISVKHPVTGDEYLLKMREAYLMYFYAVNQATGMTLENKFFDISVTDVTNGWIELDERVKDDSVEIIGLVLNVDYTVEYESVNLVTRIIFTGTLVEGSRYFVKFYFNGGFIPEMKANRVRRIVLPTIDELKQIVPGIDIDVKVFDYRSNSVRNWDDAYADAILIPHDKNPLPDEPLVEIDSYTSVDSFYELGTTIYKELLNHYRLYSNIEDSRIRGHVEMMADAIYMDQMMTMSQFDNYEEWFADNNITIPYMAKADWAKFASDIFNKATGLEYFQKSTARSIQAAMVSIVEKLSSYNIQIIASMLDNIYDCGTLVLRLDEDLDTFSERGFQWDPTLQIVDADTSSSAFAELDEHHAGADLEVSEEAFNTLEYILPVEIQAQFDVEDMEDIPIMLNGNIFDFEVENLIFNLYDPDAEALFARSLTPISDEQKTRVSNVFTTLKNANILSKLDGFIISPRWQDEQSGLLDWKRPTTIHIQQGIGYPLATWEQDVGMQGHGPYTSTFLDNFRPYYDGVNYTANNAGIGVYLTAPPVANSMQGFVGNGGNGPSMTRIGYHGPSQAYWYMTLNGNDAQITVVDPTPPIGMLQLNRNAADNLEFFVNGVLKGASNVNDYPRQLTQQEGWIGFGPGYASSDAAFGAWWIGAPLTPVEQDILTDAIEAYLN